VKAYGEVAVARLASRVKPNGPVVGTMCAMGARMATRRCQNGRSDPAQCIPPITNATIQWPMAVSLWKIGHPDLEEAVTDWRGNGETGHLPNIEWVIHTPGTSKARAWSGPLPQPGETSPSGMPAMGDLPGSSAAGWGAPKIAKVVPCDSIPAKYRYQKTDRYYCDSMPNASATSTNVDEAYEVWRSLQGAWPPTKPCKDDMASLAKVLTEIKIPQLLGQNCTVVYDTLIKVLPGFDCDNTLTQPPIRQMCCSVCGNQPIPDVPSAPAPPPAPVGQGCSVCNHVYNSERDGEGKTFEELPDSWKCPVCGAPKSAYHQVATTGEWVHELYDEEGSSQMH